MEKQKNLKGVCSKTKLKFMLFERYLIDEQKVSQSYPLILHMLKRTVYTTEDSYQSLYGLLLRTTMDESCDISMTDIAYALHIYDLSETIATLWAVKVPLSDVIHALVDIAYAMAYKYESSLEADHE